ncbi:MAG: adenylate/guanylate cyclase domain-containing protein, partial [Longimicrobiales bacterium]
LPEWTLSFVVFIEIVGFPLALVMAWAFDITPSGVYRTGSPTEEGGEASDAAAPAPTGSGGTTARDSRPARPVLAHFPADVLLPGSPGAAAMTSRAGSTRSADGTAPSDPPDPARVERASLAQLREEMRTPALAILGYARMVLEDVPATRASLRSDLEKIGLAGESFLALLEDLLDPGHPTWNLQTPDRDELLGRMRHDLRTPLNAIIGYAELIQETEIEPETDAALAGDIERIVASGRQLLDILEEAVRFATTRTMEGAGHSRTAALAQEVLAKIQPLHADAAALPLRQGTLLVVDDVEANRDLLARQLARQGYTVSSAASGGEALGLLGEQRFDLVLLDIFMPGMDGVEVLSRIRSDPALVDLPIIVISALDETDGVVRCMEMGADDFLSKPFDAVLLGARIGTILEVQRLRAQERSHARALEKQQEWVDDLLRRAFPAVIADKLRTGEATVVESSADATVLVAGLHGTSSLARSGPAALVEHLGELFGRFDSLVEDAGLDTVKTVGPRYIVAAGLPAVHSDHARLMADLALAMRDETTRYGSATGTLVRPRIGVHTGAAFAGIISGGRLAFDIWGDAVDTAQQLQLDAAPGTIQVSPSTFALLGDDFVLTSRGVVQIPGIGQMRAYLLQGRTEPVALR